jgi:hypothetical protein
MEGLLILPLAAALAGFFLWSVHSTGARIAAWLRLTATDDQATRLALGLTAYVLIGLALGAVGWYRWPVLVVCAVAPGLVNARRGLARVRELFDATGRARFYCGIDLPYGTVLSALILGYVALAAAPSFHYDLLVNYLAVPKDYLLQGHLGSLPHNVHSSLSLALHVVVGFLLALSEPINRTDFLFGTAPVWGAFHLIAIVAIGHRLRALAVALSPTRDCARRAGLLGLALWLTMPQTALLALLENAEFATTYLAVAIAGAVLTVKQRNDPVVVGLLCGLLVAAKPQAAAFAGIAMVVAIARSSVAKAVTSAAAAALLPTIAMIRNYWEYGSPLFPYLGGSGSDATASRLLLAENAVRMPDGVLDLLGRLSRLAMLQPETGITVLVLILVVFARVRNPGFWALTAVAILAPVVSSSNAHNLLRWTQPGLVLLTLAAAVNLVELVPSRSPVRWAIAALLAANLALAVSFVVRTTGPCDHLRESTTRFMSRQIPDYPMRLELMGRERRVLWLGQLFGYYGAAKGAIPAPQNGAWLANHLGNGTVEEIHQRLGASGFRWIAVSRLHGATAPDSAYWSWLDDSGRRTLEDLVRSLPVERFEPGIAVYDLGAPATGPRSDALESPGKDDARESRQSSGGSSSTVSVNEMPNRSSSSSAGSYSSGITGTTTPGR